MERNSRKTKIGTVISTSMDKTIVVETSTLKKHPLYQKRVKTSKRYKAHDENNVCKVGDKVSIMETRPLSKTKNWRLVEVVEEAK